MRGILIIPDDHPFLGPGPVLIAIDIGALDLSMHLRNHSTIRLEGEYWGPIKYDPSRPVDLNPDEFDPPKRELEP